MFLRCFRPKDASWPQEPDLSFNPQHPSNIDHHPSPSHSPCHDQSNFPATSLTLDASFSFPLSVGPPGAQHEEPVDATIVCLVSPSSSCAAAAIAAAAAPGTPTSLPHASDSGAASKFSPAPLAPCCLPDAPHPAGPASPAARTAAAGPLRSSIDLAQRGGKGKARAAGRSGSGSRLARLRLVSASGEARPGELRALVTAQQHEAAATAAASSAAAPRSIRCEADHLDHFFSGCAADDDQGLEQQQWETDSQSSAFSFTSRTSRSVMLPTLQAMSADLPLTAALMSECMVIVLTE